MTIVFRGYTYLLEILVYVKKNTTTIDSGMKFCRGHHSIHVLILILKPPHTAWPLFHGK